MHPIFQSGNGTGTFVVRPGTIEEVEVNHGKVRGEE